MAGGIAILLAIIVLLVVAGIALALYGTGGLLWLRKSDPRRDRIADAACDSPGERRQDFVGRAPHPTGSR